MNTGVAVNKPIAKSFNSGLSRSESVSTSAAGVDRMVWVVVLTIGVFYLLTIRQGHNWGDDFSMYIQHALNITHGERYNATSYLYYPPYIGPDSYPPVFPLFLTPVVWLFGVNFTAMKVELILAFLAALLLLVKITKPYLSPSWQAGLLLLIGLNPYFWDFKDHIKSEIPFFVAAYLSIYLVQKFYQTTATGIARYGWMLATGTAFYLAYGTRSIGLLLLPCLAVYDLIRNRKISFYVVGTGIVTITFIVIQYYLLRSDRTYVEMVQPDSGSFLRDWMRFILLNVPRYTGSLTQIWDNGHSKLFRLGVTGLMLGLGWIGFLAQAKKEVTFIALFVALYTLCVVIVPMDGGVRYLLPVVPFYIFYSLLGIKAFPSHKGLRRGVMTAVAVAILITYVGGYSTHNFREIPNGVTRVEANELFEYIKQTTSQRDVVIFTKPRALALFTGRQVSFYPMLLDDNGIWKYFRRINASHIVLGPEGVEPYDQAFLSKFLDRYKGYVREEYSNAVFKVYRITGMPDSAQLGI
mgnify:CR=1 FL=1